MAGCGDMGHFTQTVSRPGIGKEEQPPFRSLLPSTDNGNAPPPESWKWTEDSTEFCIEVREYPAMVVAETPYLASDGTPGCLPCSWFQSRERRIRGAAFFRLAGYIGVFSEFRGIGRFFPPQNRSTDAAADAKQTQAMAMTAPVLLQPQAIAMTAPVAMSPPSNQSGSAVETMAFVLPFQQYRSVAAAPVPTNQHVSLKEKAGGFFAVLQAHGPKKSVPELNQGCQSSTRNREEFAKMLREKLGEHLDFARMFKVKEGAEPQILGYNDPWNPMQTRELHLPLEKV
eukprot:gnl/TRDRNA2_/TRDRNA2_40081_c0_seq1.p1 gnl/TRDRNA2_/TRDRNA2_40081_c0~~gnl/TRDRNA2_/TRDRNA2_40081_c0_seq1.p1  ORF type:complete len:299 (+),score=60.57 gnl/TRDRNA2_/TRDRNA2_40081_c0_seq1:43-897(+)